MSDSGQFPASSPAKPDEPSVSVSQTGPIPIVNPADDTIFSGGPSEPSNRGLLFGILAVAILAIVGGLLLRGRESPPPLPPNTVLPADPAARSLVFSQLAMSQSTSLSGGTSTFLDGHIRNTGTATLTAATVQVIFRNDVGLSPQVETLPLSIIRTRQPYVDTEPLSAAPLASAQEAEFRLIFESIPDNWNQQMPDVRVVHATLQ